MIEDLKHLDDESLALLCDEELQSLVDADRVAAFEEHLNHCVGCARDLQRMKSAIFLQPDTRTDEYYEKAIGRILSSLPVDKHHKAVQSSPERFAILWRVVRRAFSRPSWSNVQHIARWALVGCLLLIALLSQARRIVPDEYLADPLAYSQESPRQALFYSWIVEWSIASAESTKVESGYTRALLLAAMDQKFRMHGIVTRLAKHYPDRDLPQEELMPAELLEAYAVARFAYPDKSSERPTIAVGSFEALPIVPNGLGQDLQALADGLALLVAEDLASVPSIRVLERHHLTERESESHRPRGRPPILPAQSYVFGYVMQEDSLRLRVILQWVDTKTGEIMWSKSEGGYVTSTSDAFKLERSLVLDGLVPCMIEASKTTRYSGLAGSIHSTVAAHLNARQQGLHPAISYWALMRTMGKAIQADYDGHFFESARQWTNVAKLNPSDTSAPRRAQGLIRYEKMRSILRDAVAPL